MLEDLTDQIKDVCRFLWCKGLSENFVNGKVAGQAHYICSLHDQLRHVAVIH